MKKIILLGTAVASMAVSAQAQTMVTNGGMEAFRTYQAGFLPPATLTAPDNWNGIDSFVFVYGPAIKFGGNFKKQIFKSTDKHGGTYACRIETRYQDTITVPGVLTNGQISVDLNNFTFSFSGGQPINQQVASVNAWVKYYGPNTADSGDMNIAAVVSAVDGSDSVGVGDVNVVIGPSDTFKYVSAPIAYANGITPNHLRITFGANSIYNVPTQADDSSTLTVDDITITDATGITGPAGDNAAVKWYPNPANGTLHLIGTTGQELVWEACNAAGQVMVRTAFTGETAINTASFAPGAYFYRVNNKSGVILQQGHILIQH